MFRTADVEKLHQRLDKLTPESKAKWGKMNAHQMLSHLRDSMKMTLGEIQVKDTSTFFSRMIMKPLVLYVLPWPKGKIQTAPELEQHQLESWADDVATVKQLMTRIAEKPDSDTWPPNPFLGHYTPGNWRRMMRSTPSTTSGSSASEHPARIAWEAATATTAATAVTGSSRPRTTARCSPCRPRARRQPAPIRHRRQRTPMTRYPRQRARARCSRSASRRNKPGDGATAEVDGANDVAPPDSAGTLLSLAGPDADTRTAPPTPGHPPPAAAGAGGRVRDRLTATLPGRYDVGDELGRGGMGMVLTAFDRNAQREVAIKRMLTGMPGEHERRFVQEGQVTAQLEHPAVVPVHDVGVDEHGHVFFAMKLVRGESLGERIARAVRDVRAGIPAEQAFPMLQRLDVVRRVGEALAFAHSRRVIHRDLKPDNVMIGAFGEVLVMDWGLARILDQPPTPMTPTGATKPCTCARRSPPQCAR